MQKNYTVYLIFTFFYLCYFDIFENFFAQIFRDCISPPENNLLLENLIVSVKKRKNTAVEKEPYFLLSLQSNIQILLFVV